MKENTNIKICLNGKFLIIDWELKGSVNKHLYINKLPTWIYLTCFYFYDRKIIKQKLI